MTHNIMYHHRRLVVLIVNYGVVVIVGVVLLLFVVTMNVQAFVGINYNMYPRCSINDKVVVTFRNNNNVDHCILSLQASFGGRSLITTIEQQQSTTTTSTTTSTGSSTVYNNNDRYNNAQTTSKRIFRALCATPVIEQQQQQQILKKRRNDDNVFIIADKKEILSKRSKMLLKKNRKKRLSSLDPTTKSLLLQSSTSITLFDTDIDTSTNTTEYIPTGNDHTGDSNEASLTLNSNNNNDNSNNIYKQRRQDSLDVGNDPLISFNINLDAVGKKACAPYRAEELYNRIIALNNEGYYSTLPDIVSFNTVLMGWQYNPNKALEFWENEVPQLYNRTGVYPNVRSYNIFLLSLANNGYYEASIDLLRQMLEPDSATYPNVISYNIILLACVNNGSIDSSIIAEDIFHEMLTNGSDLHLLNSNNNNYPTDVTIENKATTILNEMLSSTYNNKNNDGFYTVPNIKPDTISFNTMLQALANHKSVTAAVRADKWFHQMKVQMPYIIDQYTYTSLIKVWINSNANPTLLCNRVLEILNEMESNRNINLHPNKFIYTQAIQVLAKNKQLDKAEEILLKMISLSQLQKDSNKNNNNDIYPDVVTYTTLINGWASVAYEQPKVSITSVLRLLKQMKQSSTLQQQQPNDITYTSILKVISLTRRGDAGQLGEQFIKRYIDNTLTSIIHYNAVLQCYSQSTSTTKAIDAIRFCNEYNIFNNSNNSKKIGSDNCFHHPDIITYNTILCCCANAGGSSDTKQKSLQIGLHIFKDLIQQNQQREQQEESSTQVQNSNNNHNNKSSAIIPTSLTFYYMFKMMQRLMTVKVENNQNNNEQKQLVTKLFRLCCFYGCLNNLIVQKLVQLIGFDEVTVLFQQTTNKLIRENPTTTVSSSTITTAKTLTTTTKIVSSDTTTQNIHHHSTQLPKILTNWSKNAIPDHKKRFKL